jgi:hypothetical protein
MRKKEQQTERVLIKMTKEHKEKVEFIKEKTNLNFSEMIRLWIDHQYELLDN